MKATPVIPLLGSKSAHPACTHSLTDRAVSVALRVNAALPQLLTLGVPLHMPLYPFLCLHPVEEYFRSKRAIKSSPHVWIHRFSKVWSLNPVKIYTWMPVTSLFVNHFVLQPKASISFDQYNSFLPSYFRCHSVKYYVAESRSSFIPGTAVLFFLTGTLWIYHYQSPWSSQVCT